MSGTQITQFRQPVLIDQSTKYQITATCTVTGTLPDNNIFVRQMVIFDDPKDDVFYRVATPADFLSLPTDRNDAIESGLNEEGAYLYRASSFTQNYEDVATATGAWVELSSRINALVTDYDTYIDTFLTPTEGAITTYPTVDESVKTALIAAYEGTLDTIEAAETARDAENIACDALRLELETAQQQLLEAQQDAAALAPIVGSLAPIGGALTSLSSGIEVSATNASSQVTTSAASAGEKNSINALLNSVLTQTQTMDATIANLEAGVNIPLNTLLSTVQARAAALQADVSSLTIQVNACTLEMATMQAAVDSARQQRDAALQAVRAVCPDYIP
jgi:hypothetical protein